MPIHDFPFTTQRGIARPMLWVRVSTPEGTKRTSPLLAKIDTGADGCFFPADIADELDYKLDPEESVEVVSSIGTGFAYPPHKSTIEVLEMSADGLAGKRLRSIPNVPIYFVEKGTQFLLRTKGFLNRCVLTVDYLNQVFSLALRE